MLSTSNEESAKMDEYRFISEIIYIYVYYFWNKTIFIFWRNSSLGKSSHWFQEYLGNDSKIYLVKRYDASKIREFPRNRRRVASKTQTDKYKMARDDWQTGNIGQLTTSNQSTGANSQQETGLHRRGATSRHDVDKYWIFNGQALKPRRSSVRLMYNVVTRAMRASWDVYVMKCFVPLVELFQEPFLETLKH